MPDTQPPTSESLSGSDGRTSSNAAALAKKVRGFLALDYPTTDLRQDGYGPASFRVDIGDALIATVTVDVQRDSKSYDEGEAPQHPVLTPLIGKRLRVTIEVIADA